MNRKGTMPSDARAAIGPYARIELYGAVPKRGRARGQTAAQRAQAERTYASTRATSTVRPVTESKTKPVRKPLRSFRWRIAEDWSWRTPVQAKNENEARAKCRFLLGVSGSRNPPGFRIEEI